MHHKFADHMLPFHQAISNTEVHWLDWDKESSSLTTSFRYSFQQIQEEQHLVEHLRLMQLCLLILLEQLRLQAQLQLLLQLV